MWGFFKLFRKSPMGLLVDHFIVTKEVYFLCTKNYGKWKDGEEVSIKQIDETEHRADEIKQQINEIITSSLMSSIRKEDILSLVKTQDCIADAAEDVIKYLDFKLFKLDPKLEKILDNIFEVTTKAILEYERLLMGFCQYQRANFAPRYKKKIPKEVATVAKYEKEVDNLAHSFGKLIFNMEDKFSPVKIFFLSKLITLIDRITDNLENGADRIKRMIAK